MASKICKFPAIFTLKHRKMIISIKSYNDFYLKTTNNLNLKCLSLILFNVKLQYQVTIFKQILATFEKNKECNSSSRKRDVRQHSTLRLKFTEQKQKTQVGQTALRPQKKHTVLRVKEAFLTSLLSTLSFYFLIKIWCTDLINW